MTILRSITVDPALRTIHVTHGYPWTIVATHCDSYTVDYKQGTVLFVFHSLEALKLGYEALLYVLQNQLAGDTKAGPTADADFIERMRALFHGQSQSKIEVIKQIRVETGWGLAAAKDWFERKVQP